MTSAVNPLQDIGTIILGTRGSKLAMAQSGLVAEAINRCPGCAVELKRVSTHGDRSHAPVAELGTTGVWTSALREALLAGEIDIAVHSYKDLPTAPADGISLAAVPKRENPSDVLVARDGLKLVDLPTGARVGTGAPRRVAQLRAFRPDLEIVPIRGNIDTRMSKVTGGELDAVVLAYAGLARLGRLDDATDVLTDDVMLPAPAQGALAVECRADGPLAEMLLVLDDPISRAAVVAERAVLAEVDIATSVWCNSTVAAHAVPTVADDGAVTLTLQASVTAFDGSDAVRMSASGFAHDADGLGRRLAAALLTAGAAKLMESP
ncbi:hydroxymethylbilane synthase [Fodinicola feengrottensis]|uniref:Porphobilinogen deaminase n=1 Tax=Fodinicola feengrottensis TaxID=435914 RepID=A0ABN2FR25_9ACTN|nr:hydroxymethylbilane synthase [Fodinicola feengrottensis]